jgi:transposase
MLPITTILFPSCPDLLLEEITRKNLTLFVTVRSSQSSMRCPDCAHESLKIHSRYPRTLADLSLMEYAVVLRSQVRRFFCSNPACPRKTFAEPFADPTMAHARRTNRQASRLSAIALAPAVPLRYSLAGHTSAETGVSPQLSSFSRLA